jgi:hypothetical protein
LSSAFREACCTPAVVIQTSPEDLLTDQAPSSAANAWEAANSTDAAATMRENLWNAFMTLSLEAGDDPQA